MDDTRALKSAVGSGEGRVESRGLVGGLEFMGFMMGWSGNLGWWYAEESESEMSWEW